MENPFHPAPDGLNLIETVLWDGHACPLLAGHLARLSDGAQRLGWPLDIAQARMALTGPGGRAACLRLLLDRHGAITVATLPVPAPIACWRLGLAAQKLQSDDPWLRVKSSNRGAYDAARRAIPATLDEVVLTNERGEVCDATITTVFFDRGAGLRTPPQSAGLLPGVLRADMLARGLCTPEVLRVDDLPHVRLWVGNALRGLSPARWMPPQSL